MKETSTSIEQSILDVAALKLTHRVLLHSTVRNTYRCFSPLGDRARTCRVIFFLTISYTAASVANVILNEFCIKTVHVSVVYLLLVQVQLLRLLLSVCGILHVGQVPTIPYTGEL